MKRPTKQFGLSDGFMQPIGPAALPDPQLEPIRFEELLRNRGVRFVHYKAAQCPNVNDLDAGVHDPNCRICENGMVFFGAGEILGVFQQNRLERMYEILGTWDIGEAVVTFSAYQDGPGGEIGQGPAVELQHFDKLVCLDYTFRWQEILEHSPTGIDRLRYPAISVEYLATKEKIYYVGKDFEVTPEGHIRWLSQNQPGYNQIRDRGEIYTISYCAQPVYYVVQIMHEMRITKAYDPMTAEIKAVRLPQTVLVRRDYLFNDPNDKHGNATTSFPRSSGGNITPA